MVYRIMEIIIYIITAESHRYMCRFQRKQNTYANQPRKLISSQFTCKLRHKHTERNGTLSHRVLNLVIMFHRVVLSQQYPGMTEEKRTENGGGVSGIRI